MELSIKTRQAYSEIDEFLSLLTEEDKNRIPRKLREFFKEEKDSNYIKGIREDISIKEQNLKEETLAIIALLNLQYWCTDDIEKKRLKDIYAKNENEYQAELREKYNPDDIFKNKKSKEENAENENDVQLVEIKKENWIKRFIGKLLNIFRRKSD